jgi:hypothetical protein
MEYRLSDVEAKNVPFTVIIDESSMLTKKCLERYSGSS